MPTAAGSRPREIPADRSRIGAFFIADQEREKNSIELLDRLLKSNPGAGTDAGRIADYYNAYLDTAAIDRAGIAPAKADLDAIAAHRRQARAVRRDRRTLRADIDPLNATNFQTENLFGMFVTQGLEHAGRNPPLSAPGRARHARPRILSLRRRRRWLRLRDQVQRLCHQRC